MSSTHRQPRTHSPKLFTVGIFISWKQQVEQWFPEREREAGETTGRLREVGYSVIAGSEGKVRVFYCVGKQLQLTAELHALSSVLLRTTAAVTGSDVFKPFLGLKHHRLMLKLD